MPHTNTYKNKLLRNTEQLNKDMIHLAFAFLFLSIIATGIIVWLNTKSGKKWLASL